MPRLSRRRPNRWDTSIREFVAPDWRVRYGLQREALAAAAADVPGVSELQEGMTGEANVLVRVGGELWNSAVRIQRHPPAPPERRLVD